MRIPRLPTSSRKYPADHFCAVCTLTARARWSSWCFFISHRPFYMAPIKVAGKFSGFLDAHFWASCWRWHSRFFVAHVFLLPAAILGLVAAHVYLFRKAGAAGPPSEDPVNPRLPTQRFYPRQGVMDTIVALVMILVLGALAHFAPTELGPKANPADTQDVPRPEWYYLPFFQWLKYFKGPWAVVGIVIFPT